MHFLLENSYEPASADAPQLISGSLSRRWG
jgi:hypothetical protein